MNEDRDYTFGIIMVHVRINEVENILVKAMQGLFEHLFL